MNENLNLSLSVPFSSIIITILAIVFVVDLILAWRTWISNRKHPANIYFALTILMVSFWTLTIMLGERVFNDPFLISVFIRGCYFFATLLIFFFYIFTHYFPYKTSKLSLISFVFLLLSTIFIVFISIWPNILIAGRVLPQNRFNPEISLFWHLVFALYFLTMVVLSYYNLFVKYKKSGGILRQRLRQVIIATSVATVGGSIFSLLIPIIHSEILDWLGPIFTLFMAAYIWYYIFWLPSRVDKN